MKTYTVSLPNYTIGTEAYKAIPHECGFYGKNAVVIGGKTAMAKSKDALLEGVKGSDIKITDFIWYGGDASFTNGDKLIADERVRNADMLFVVGGGRACDTGKYVADVLDKPLFTFPTVASNCAAPICGLPTRKAAWWPNGSATVSRAASTACSLASTP